MSDLSGRLARARNRGRYLAELDQFVRRPIREEELLGLEDTQRILEVSKGTQRARGLTERMPFHEKSSPRFRSFIERLATLNGSPVYFWIPLATVCGFAPTLSLNDVNFDFKFDVSPDGIVVILTADLKDRFLLDYEEDEAGQWVQLELSGEHWSKASY